MDRLHPAELTGRRVLILGLGSFGGGAGACRALHGFGAALRVTDLRPAAALTDALDALADLELDFVLGEHREEDFAWAEVVVVNPAVPAGSPWLARAEALGCKLTTEVNLAIALRPQLPTVAITGTHGKSTCAAISAHLLGGLPGRTVLGGNLGGSLLEQVQELGDGDRLVVEMSSFQCERLVAPAGWPTVAILTSFGADHLDRHGDLATYGACKRRLLGAQTSAQTLLLPPPTDDAVQEAEVAAWQREAHGTVHRLRLDEAQRAGLEAEDLPFTESYRLPSLLAALHAARLLGMEDEALRERTRSFPGLPHRMARFTREDGRVVLDNGVATHPSPTAAALRHLEGPVLLLAGGKDKGLPLAEVLGTLRDGHRLYLHGEGGRRLAEEAAATVDPATDLRHFPRAEEAFHAALDEQRPDETLLFSPTFSSYDEFRNFSDRARLFLSLGRFLHVGEGEGTASPATRDDVTAADS